MCWGDEQLLKLQMERNFKSIRGEKLRLEKAKTPRC